MRFPLILVWYILPPAQYLELPHSNTLMQTACVLPPPKLPTSAPKKTSLSKTSAWIAWVKTSRKSTALLHPKPGSQLTSCCIWWLLSWSVTAFLGGKFSCPSEAGPSGCTPGSTWKASKMPASSGTAGLRSTLFTPREKRLSWQYLLGEQRSPRKPPTSELHCWTQRKVNTTPEISQPGETCAGILLEPSTYQCSWTKPPTCSSGLQRALGSELPFVPHLRFQWEASATPFEASLKQ